MQHGRRWNRHLRRTLRHGIEKREVRDLDRLDVPHGRRDFHHRRRKFHVALRRVELHRDTAFGLDPCELFEEVDMEIRAPELAVGDSGQAGVLLEVDDVANRRVLGHAQLRLRDFAFGAAVARGEELGGTKEAADVVGAKRRRGTQCHVTISLNGCPAIAARAAAAP
jgi:hypothetical protein